MPSIPNKVASPYLNTSSPGLLHGKQTKRMPREDSTRGHHQMVNIEIRLVIFFADKDGEALYSQQK